MFIILPLCCLFSMSRAYDHYYSPNISRSTLPGIAAYRSALTLDWLAAEDTRQRELVAAFETEQVPPIRMVLTDCMGYASPSSEKIARLLLELLKNLEGDEGTIIVELIQALVRAKLLIESSSLESEPDLDALVKTPNVMMGEPHKTFPRILAMTWLTVTDSSTTAKYGWCPLNKITKYITSNKAVHIAEQMRALDPILARARFIMEEFIQHVTPLNMFQKMTARKKEASLNQKVKVKGHKDIMIDVRVGHVAAAQSATPKKLELLNFDEVNENEKFAASSANMKTTSLLNIVFDLFCILIF